MSIVIDSNPVVNWSEVHEKILIDWADKATCYRWLHNKSYNKYSCQNAWFTIPVIVISTLTGTANFSQEAIPDNRKTYYSMTIGIFNLIAGLITTIKQFLKIPELSESHRISCIGWAKFQRDIKVELSKEPSDRLNPDQLIKKSKEEYERLIETSPNIPKYIIQSFKTAFNGRKYNLLNLCNEIMCCYKCRKKNYQEDPFNLLRLKVERKKLEEFSKISKPEICNTLQPTKHFTYRYTTEQEHTQNKHTKQRHTDILINSYYNDFYTIRKRYPDNDEIHAKFPDISIDIIQNAIPNNQETIKRIEETTKSKNPSIYNNLPSYIDKDSTDSLIQTIINID
tara:strand:- start:1801 stop:2817 length:1017 start_codon:yes stop_codon:yes gene_type:complete